MTDARIPRVVLAYGLLGIAPFWLPVLAGLVRPDWRSPAGFALAAYGALILSFLGGARWGLEARRAPPDPRTVSLSMLPSLAGFAALAPPVPRAAALLALAAALALHWAWDAASTGLPGWYPRLRGMLSLGAVSGLLAGAAMLRG